MTLVRHRTKNKERRLRGIAMVTKNELRNLERSMEEVYLPAFPRMTIIRLIKTLREASKP